MKKFKYILTMMILVVVSACSAGVQKDVMKGYEKLEGIEHNYERLSSIDFTEKLINKEGGIYFIGANDSFWSIEVAEMLNDILKENDAKAYYLDVRNKDYLENSKARENLILFDKTLTEKDKHYGGIPFVIGINNKEKVKTHLGTLYGQEEGEGLTSIQYQEVKEYLEEVVRHTIESKDDEKHTQDIIGGEVKENDE